VDFEISTCYSATYISGNAPTEFGYLPSNQLIALASSVQSLAGSMLTETLPSIDLPIRQALRWVLPLTKG
jgi:hypothetical protein